MTLPVTTSLSLRPSLEAVRQNLRGVLEGKDDVLELVLMAVVAGGHVLLEDVPGVGKTTLAKALARSFSATFARVQCTPDLLPSDMLGSQVLNPREGTFTFHKGPVFTHVLLADEINRASPRTQSALLESMSEAQVTVDGVTYPLPRPFLVLATQNPVESTGTYPLPEAQLDRFLVRIHVGYPTADAELRMLHARKLQDPLSQVEPVADASVLLAAQDAAREVTVDDAVARYLLRLVARTREASDLSLGASPRASLGLYRACQARAFLQGRDYVSPDDVQTLAAPVLAHRLQLAPRARHGGRTTSALVGDMLRAVEVPS